MTLSDMVAAAIANNAARGNEAAALQWIEDLLQQSWTLVQQNPDHEDQDHSEQEWERVPEHTYIQHCVWNTEEPIEASEWLETLMEEPEESATGAGNPPSTRGTSSSNPWGSETSRRPQGNGAA